MPHRFHMVFQRFLIDRKTFEHHVRFAQCKSIALDRIGVICVLDRKILIQPLQLSRCQRTSLIKLCLLCDNLLNQRFFSFIPTVARLRSRVRYEPDFPLSPCAVYFPLQTKNAYPPIADTPLFGSLFSSHCH